jgi:hypothetical protein
MRVLCLAIGPLLLTGNQAMADGQRPRDTFEAWGVECEGGSNPGEIREKNGQIRILNLLNEGPVLSRDPRLDGPAQVLIKVSIDSEMNTARAHGTLVLGPTAYEGQGRWVGLFTIELPGTPTRVKGIDTFTTGVIVAHGTGVFEGYKLRFRHFVDPNLPGPPPMDIPAGCVYTGEYWKGAVVELLE